MQSEEQEEGGGVWPVKSQSQHSWFIKQQLMRKGMHAKFSDSMDYFWSPLLHEEDLTCQPNRQRNQLQQRPTSSTQHASHLLHFTSRHGRLVKFSSLAHSPKWMVTRSSWVAIPINFLWYIFPYEARSSMILFDVFPRQKSYTKRMLLKEGEYSTLLASRKHITLQMRHFLS